MKVFLQLNKNAWKHLQHWQWKNFFGWRYCWTEYFNYMSYMNRKSGVFSILVLEFLMVITNSSRWINFRACQLSFFLLVLVQIFNLKLTKITCCRTGSVNVRTSFLWKLRRKLYPQKLSEGRDLTVPCSEIWRFQISN